MNSATFAYPDLFVPGASPPAPKWSGFPQYNFIGGHNDPDSIPSRDLSNAAAAVLEREGPTLATYRMQSGPLGYLPLRQFISRRVRDYARIECSPQDVLVTSGSGQGLDLVFDILLQPGDTVIIEQHSYGGAINNFKRRGVRLEGIALDDEGMRIDALEQRLDALRTEGVRPKMMYLIPTVQNPTGAIMGEPRRRELLAIAKSFEVPILEDECYSDLIWEGERPPALYALDADATVIHIGSFSKSISPALRIGYVISNWDVLSRLLPLKTDGGTGALDQMVLAEYCNEHFETHVATLSQRLQAKYVALTDALAEHFGTSAEFSTQRGGIYLWIKLPDAVDIVQLAAKALEAGIAINPGPEWSTDLEGTRSHLRICFANPALDTLHEGVGLLAQVCRDLTGVPEHIANR